MPPPFGWKRHEWLFNTNLLPFLEITTTVVHLWDGVHWQLRSGQIPNRTDGYRPRRPFQKNGRRQRERAHAREAVKALHATRTDTFEEFYSGRPTLPPASRMPFHAATRRRTERYTSYPPPARPTRDLSGRHRERQRPPRPAFPTATRRRGALHMSPVGIRSGPAARAGSVSHFFNGRRQGGAARSSSVVVSSRGDSRLPGTTSSAVQHTAPLLIKYKRPTCPLVF
jgi:hypothetical protein